MITPVDNQSWSSELVTGNAQFTEIDSTIYIVSQVRADNTFAVFVSEPAPPQPGPGAVFAAAATYTFPHPNSSFDPVVAFDGNNTIYIVGTQDNGNCTDVILFYFNIDNLTLVGPTTLVTASYVRDSYDICSLSASQFIAIAFTNPQQIWTTPAVAEVTNINIASNVLTVEGNVEFSVGQQITLSGLQNAVFMNGVTVTVASTTPGVSFTATYTHSNYTQVGYENGFASWLPGHSLVGFEVVGNADPVSLVGATSLDSSPFRSGNTFGAVSCYSPDGSTIEVYYESHPKQITFQDQTFSVKAVTRTADVWSSSTVLTTFTSRYADSRLTVVAQGSTRTLLQQFYNQLVYQNALVGNLLLGYYTGSAWSFQVIPGSTTSSYIQGTLSIANTQGTSVSYLAEPVYSVRGVWSPQVETYYVNDRVSYNGTSYIVNTAVTYLYAGAWKPYTSYTTGAVVQVAVPTFPVSYAYYTAKNAISSTTVSPNLDTTNWTSTPVPTADSRFTQAPTAWPLHTATLHIDTVDGVSTFNLVDAPGFYNNLNFTWLRGTKDILDDLTKWGVVGEQILAQGEGDAVFGARYISGFDTPPVVNLVPDTHLPSSTTVIRGTPFLFNASGTNDANLDPVTFDWTFTPANSHVTLTPVAPLNTTANLLVNRTIGGDAQSFIVGLVATTSSSPAMTITTIGIASNVLTVGTSASVNLASTEEVFLYNIGTATFLNDLMVVVTGTSGDSFTANFTHADYTSTADTGNAVANAQFGWCNVTVPYNPSPTITFPTNPIAADRNSLVIISPTYTGIVESDDATTYLWTQVSGNPLVVSGGVTSSVLRVNTNGALIQGESSVWSLTVNDGVNSPVTASVTINIVAYPFDIQDTLQLSRSLWGPTATISQRNTTHTWVPLDVSGIYTNFQSIKRSSAFDGSDRYLLISPASVCVFGGIQPNMALLRKLFVPLDSEGNQNAIIDAVHTEDDTTFVLDSAGNLYRYSTAPLISTDNPDTTIVLSTEASMSFNKVFSTYSFNNIRIIVLTGVDGCLLLQVQNIGMTIEGTLELTVESGELYGIDNVQFVRTSNVESLSTGKILIGTIALVSANIQSINITGNIVTVVANNTYTAGHVVTFNGLTAATFLNGAKATVTSATPTQFVVSYQHANYGTTSEGTGATAVAGGKTYETLIDLSHGQIIGIFDASNLRNQFVTTGEILFETNDTYAGRPAAPILNPIGVGSLIGGDYVDLTVSWSAERPDLIQYYILESSFDEMTWTRTLINSGYVETITLPEPIGQHIYFRVQAVSTDGASPYSNIEEANTGQPPPPPVISTGFAVLFGVGFGTT